MAYPVRIIPAKNQHYWMSRRSHKWSLRVKRQKWRKSILGINFDDQNSTSQSWLRHFGHQNVRPEISHFGWLHFLSPLAPPPAKKKSQPDEHPAHRALAALHRGRAVHAKDAHHGLLPAAQPQPARHPRGRALRPLHPRLGDHRALLELRQRGTDGRQPVRVKLPFPERLTFILSWELVPLLN